MRDWHVEGAALRDHFAHVELHVIVHAVSLHLQSRLRRAQQTIDLVLLLTPTGEHCTPADTRCANLDGEIQAGVQPCLVQTLNYLGRFHLKESARA